MMVKEVVALAAANLGREDLVQAAGSLTRPSGELISLLRCYNLVENEIALDYLPLKREETLAVTDGRVQYSQFSFAPVDIFSVKRGGRECAFTLYSDGVTVEGEGEATVLYAYSPAEKTWEDCGEYDGKVSKRLMSFGVACEFCLSRGQFSEAAVWQKRFQEALRAASLRRTRRSVRSRRWV